MPPLSEAGPQVRAARRLSKTLAGSGHNALLGLFGPWAAGARVPARTALGQLFVSLLPALALGAILALTYYVATSPDEKTDIAGLTIDTGSSRCGRADVGRPGRSGRGERATNPSRWAIRPQRATRTSLRRRRSR
jgi:hypothetical protein